MSPSHQLDSQCAYKYIYCSRTVMIAGLGALLGTCRVITGWARSGNSQRLGSDVRSVWAPFTTSYTLCKNSQLSPRPLTSLLLLRRSLISRARIQPILSPQAALTALPEDPHFSSHLALLSLVFFFAFLALLFCSLVAAAFFHHLTSYSTVLHVSSKYIYNLY